MRAVLAVALAVVLCVGGSADARRCFDKPCSRSMKRAMRAIGRCMKARAGCTVDGPELCWKSGAHQESTFRSGGLVTTRHIGPTGALCASAVTMLVPGGGPNVTWSRGARYWHAIETSDGVQVDCSDGRSDVYSRVPARCSVVRNGLVAWRHRCVEGHCPAPASGAP